jgi:pimeloyl-ACP methyl ester carboxylesterase
VLVGHSMGGVIALLHAADAPETLRALVLLSPPVPGRSGVVDVPLAVRRALLATPGVAAVVRRRLSRMTAEEVVAQQLRQATPHADRVPADAVARVVAETRVRQARPDAAAASAEQWTGILDTMAVLARPRRLRRTIASIAVPGLWLQGADDPLARAGHARALAAVRPDWPFELRQGVGHLLAVEDPDWTAGTIRRWLAGAGVSDRPTPPRPP